MSETNLYILVEHGELTYHEWSFTSEEVFDRAKSVVFQYICDFFRNQLPLKVTGEIEDRFDISVYMIPHGTWDPGVRIALPFQEWVDEYYRDRETASAEADMREYSEYLKLRAKWESTRLLNESAGIEIR